jgi:RimJ/RimL family protein N-acetyltransferase
MYGDPEVMRFLEDGRPLDRAAAFRSMAVHLGHWQLRGYGQWALEDRATGELVGRAGLWQPEGWPGLEVGWLLARASWGRGFATEAARAAIDYAFHELRAGRVISLIRPENRASIRVAERLGESYRDTIEIAGVRASIYGLDRP